MAHEPRVVWTGQSGRESVRIGMDDAGDDQHAKPELRAVLLYDKVVFEWYDGTDAMDVKRWRPLDDGLVPKGYLVAAGKTMGLGKVGS